MYAGKGWKDALAGKPQSDEELKDIAEMAIDHPWEKRTTISPTNKQPPTMMIFRTDVVHGAPAVHNNEPGRRFASFVQVTDQAVAEQETEEYATTWPAFAVIHYAAVELGRNKDDKWREGIGKAVHAAGRRSLDSYYAQEGTEELTTVGQEIADIHADWEKAKKLKEPQPKKYEQKRPDMKKR